MKYLRTENDMNYYEFTCEGCHAAGELGVDADAHRVHCPEDCGALYVQWLNPLTDEWDLHCVICPMFVSDEDTPDGEPDFTLDDLEWEEEYPNWREWGDEDDWDDDDPDGHSLECTCDDCLQNRPENEIYLFEDEADDDESI